MTRHVESTMFAITFCELFDALYLLLFIDCLSGRAKNFSINMSHSWRPPFLLVRLTRLHVTRLAALVYKVVVPSLVPRSRPAFRRSQHGKR